MKTKGSGIVYLKMDLPMSFWNMIITLPLVIVSIVATWDINIPGIRLCVGFMGGIWVASAHNVIWGWLTRRQQEREM